MRDGCDMQTIGRPMDECERDAANLFTFIFLACESRSLSVRVRLIGVLSARASGRTQRHLERNSAGDSATPSAPRLCRFIFIAALVRRVVCAPQSYPLHNVLRHHRAASDAPLRHRSARRPPGAARSAQQRCAPDSHRRRSECRLREARRAARLAALQQGRVRAANRGGGAATGRKFAPPPLRLSSIRCRHSLIPSSDFCHRSSSATSAPTSSTARGRCGTSPAWCAASPSTRRSAS